MTHEHEPTNFPLAWPIGWERHKGHRLKGPFQRSMSRSLDVIESELRKFGAVGLVVSTNLQPRLDGRPYASQARPVDPGVAVYFQLRKRPCVLACDKWSTIDANMAAIALHLESMRGQERWGVGTIEQAFAGYTALPAGGTDWRHVLDARDIETARAHYRELAKRVHPDVGGSEDEMRRLNLAMQACEMEHR